MIEEACGDLLSTKVDALVNAVNTVGVMGKGLALAFKKTFPDNFDAYHRACKAGDVTPGKMFVFERSQHSPKWIINFPTKRHWDGKSRIEDIEAGLVALAKEIRDRKIHSIAIPPLGSGLNIISRIWARAWIRRSN